MMPMIIIVIVIATVIVSYFFLRRKAVAKQSEIHTLSLKPALDTIPPPPEEKVPPLMEDESGRKYRDFPRVRDIPRKSYIYGKLTGKYWGEEDLCRLKEYTHEQFYFFHIYDAVIDAREEGIRQEVVGPFPFEMDEEFSKEKLPDRIPCILSLDGSVKGYNIVLHDPRIRKVIFIRKLHQKDNVEVFGTINAEISGHILDFVREEYVERVYESESGNSISRAATETIQNSGDLGVDVPTGNSRYKGSYKQQEFFRPNRSERYWSNWHHYRRTENGFLSFTVGAFALFIGIIFLLLILPRLAILIPFLALLFILLFLVDALAWISRISAALLGIWFTYNIVYSIATGNSGSRIESGVKDNKRVPLATINTSESLGADHPQSRSDTLVTHHFSWKDYDSKVYEGSFSIKRKDWDEASLNKSRLITPTNYSHIVYQLKEKDKGSLGMVYKMFDSLKAIHHLNELQFCNMVVSFVQNIPYVLILPFDCEPELYSDMFVKEYLISSSECEGFQRFGINSPVEFMATLKGDCDTRVLFLYTLFSHYKYDVVMLSSDLYGHSLLGINLPYRGLAYPLQQEKYVLWETTHLLKPGIISHKFSNLNYWKVSLKS